MASKTDYTFPLPKSNLHARYDSVFSAFKRGLNCTLIGIPLSARSGYLKFILEYSKDFLSEFIDPNIYHFVVLEGHLTGDELIHTITANLLSQNIFSLEDQSILENRLKIHDPQLTFTTLQSAIKKLQNKKIVIVIYETEKLLENNPQAINFLLGLWNTNRVQPDSSVQLCFIGSPVLLHKKLHASWASIRPALDESVVYFPLFSHQELSYLKNRLEFFSQSTISNVVHKLASQLSGGHTVLYRILSQLPPTELENLIHTHSHPAIKGIIETIWEGYSYLDKQNGDFPIPLLPPPTLGEEKTISGLPMPQLTAQQKIIFDYLLTRPQQVVSRDELAQVIWGKNWQEKYSDWAIDRTISNLRKRLLNSNYHLLTLRNRGYLLKN